VTAAAQDPSSLLDRWGRRWPGVRRSLFLVWGSIRACIVAARSKKAEIPVEVLGPWQGQMAGLKTGSETRAEFPEAYSER